MNTKIKRLVNDTYDELFAFYKRLGYTENQSDRLAKNIFNEKIEKTVNYDDCAQGVNFSAGGLSCGPVAKSVYLSDAEYSISGVQEHEVVLNAFSQDIFKNTESFESFIDNGFKKVLLNPSSTFSSTINTASYSIIRRALRRNEKVRHDMVRTEEMLNYFDYKLKSPTNRLFNINTEFADMPNSSNKLMFVGLKGKDVVIPRQNIIFLVDVSGSMLYSKLLQVQKSMMTVLKQLDKNDIVSLVTYSDNDSVIFTGIRVNDIDTIIDCLTTKGILGGCTYGSKGIEMAYDIAQRYYLEDGSNRVMLFTDGDFNFGICEKVDLNKFIREKKETNVFLTCLGYGYSNYKDDILETLSRNGNGNYFYIDSDEDIIEVLQKKINSNLITIAKDVKIQVEFNPKYIESYRLVGYENRQLKHEDFKNDAIIAEPVGSGHTVVAVYELVPTTEKQIISEYKYMDISAKTEVCTVSVRYKLPTSELSEELSVILGEKEFNSKEMSYNLNLSYSVMKYAELLRKSTNFSKGDGSVIIDVVNRLLTIEDNDKIKTLLEMVQNI